MKNRLFWGLIASLVLLTGISTIASAANNATDRPGFTEADSAFYLPDTLYFFYRPGLNVKITSYSIPADRHPVITFTLTDEEGTLPVDIDGVYTPISVAMRYFVSYIPVGEEQRVNYNIGSRGPTYDSGGTLTTVQLGTYTYRYGVELPAGYEVDATHTLIATGRRDMRAEPFNLSRYTSDSVVNFVPSGKSAPVTRDVVKMATCSRCHAQPVNHGRYETIDSCEQCHNPDLVADGESYSMDVVIHRHHAQLGSEFPPILNDCSTCHTGGIPTADLPMIANPNPATACDANGLSQTTLAWYDEGNIEIHMNTATGPLFAMAGGAGSAATGKWVMNGQTFVLVNSATGAAIQSVPVYNTVLGCANNPPGTYRGTAGAQWDRWTSRPSREVCGSCHEDVDFATGVNHIVQTNDDNCGTCHKPYTGNEYDRSVTGAHQVAYKSNQLPGILVKIVSVDYTGPGRNPQVTFSISDKSGPIDPNSLNRLLFSMSGPNEDFDFYVQESVLGKLKQVGTNWTYRFTAKLPNDASGSYSLGVEGRKPELINAGKANEFAHNDQMQNFIYAFPVTDTTAEPRRKVVNDALCENCHSNLSLHGENRHDAGGYCDTCHMPMATDAVVRPAGTGPAQGIHFKYMIHKIHRGEDLTQKPYIVYGYRSSVHDYSDVVFPGDLRNCESCHLDGTYEIPLPADVLPTYSPASQISMMPPTTAACVSCHDSDDAAAHADANTSANLGESCGACHGNGKTYSVERVHAR